MTMDMPSKAPAKATFWIGWVLSVLPCLLLIMSATMKLTQQPDAVKGFQEFGYDSSAVLPIGIAELVSTILYLVPQTAVLGAILLTGYLGGATATHVAAGDGMFFAPVILGVVLWLGIFLRDPRLRLLVPWRS